jgi:hypothetical protein
MVLGPPARRCRGRLRGQSWDLPNGRRTGSWADDRAAAGRRIGLQVADIRAQVLEVHDIAIQYGPKPHAAEPDTGATAGATPHADADDIPC